VFEGVSYTSSDVYDAPVIPIVADLGTITLDASSQTKYPHAFQTSLRANFLKLSDKGDQWVVNFAFPLHLVCPTLKYLGDQGAIYGGKNQPIQIILALTNASESLFAMNGSLTGTSYTYSIRNLQLMDVYTVLDAPRLELIQRSQMRFPMCTYVKYKEAVCQ
jgi:hypothetical protein